MTKDELYEENKNLVWYIINRKFHGNPDLYDIGLLGLAKGINTFNPEKAKCSTYLYRCIVNEILIYIRNENKHKCVVSYDSIMTDMKDDNDIAYQEVLADKITNIENKIVLNEQIESLYQCINTLDEIEKELIMCRYKLLDKEYKTQEEFGKEHNLSQAQICRMEKKILKKLKGLLGNVR